MKTILTASEFSRTPNGLFASTQSFVRFDNVRLNEGVYYFPAPYVNINPISDNSSRKSASLRYRDDLFQLKAVLDELDVSCVITQTTSRTFVVLIGDEVYHNPSFKIGRDGFPIVWEIRNGFVTLAYSYSSTRANNVISFIDIMGNTDSVVGSIKNCLPAEVAPFRNAVLLVHASSEEFSFTIPHLTKSWTSVPRTGLLDLQQYEINGSAAAEVCSVLYIHPTSEKITIKQPVSALQHSLHV